MITKNISWNKFKMVKFILKNQKLATYSNFTIWSFKKTILRKKAF